MAVAVVFTPSPCPAALLAWMRVPARDAMQLQTTPREPIGVVAVSRSERTFVDVPEPTIAHGGQGSVGCKENGNADALAFPSPRTPAYPGAL
uniref:Efflux pump FUB11 (Fusaric acid biosynthesis protein 11) n=1 Tax=Ganoderma boninense TaxID=34458 RepID=A0A5K1K165_9APHY|nr:Efflux pump FUB11 (Fusaric acid biosynthesis protein 11) [Ganoderma boninense]